MRGWGEGRGGGGKAARVAGRRGGRGRNAVGGGSQRAEELEASVGRLLNLASDASRPLTLPALCHLPPLPSVPPPAVPPPAPSLCFRSAVGRPWGKMGPRRGRMRPPRRGDHRRHGGLEGAVGLDGAGAARGWSPRRGAGVVVPARRLFERRRRTIYRT